MSGAKIFDLAEKRKEKIEIKKRQFERVLFDELIGTYTEINDNGTIYPVRLVNVSPTGCLIEIPKSHNPDKKIKMGSEFDLRLYFTKKSYLTISVQIKHRKQEMSEQKSEVIHYGAEFNQESASFPAVRSFVDFVYRFAEYSLVEKEENKAFFF